MGNMKREGGLTKAERPEFRLAGLFARYMTIDKALELAGLEINTGNRHTLSKLGASGFAVKTALVNEPIGHVTLLADGWFYDSVCGYYEKDNLELLIIGGEYDVSLRFKECPNSVNHLHTIGDLREFIRTFDLG